MFACRVILRLIDAEVLHQDLEPLTGLLNRAGFYEEFATLVAARSRKEDRYLVVAVIGLDSLSVCTRAGGASDARRTRIAVAQQLRETARSTAIIGHFSDSVVFADVFTTAEPAPLAERIRNVVTTTPFHRTASIGVVSTPLPPLAQQPPYEVLDEVLALGGAAMDEAREAGGNQIHYVQSSIHHVQSSTSTVLVGSDNRDGSTPHNRRNWRSLPHDRPDSQILLAQDTSEASPLTAERGAGQAAVLRSGCGDGCDGDGQRCARRARGVGY